MSESIRQMPRRIHTGSGGKRTSTMTRKMSEKHSQQHMMKICLELFVALGKDFGGFMKVFD